MNVPLRLAAFVLCTSILGSPAFAQLERELTGFANLRAAEKKTLAGLAECAAEAAAVEKQLAALAKAAVSRASADARALAAAEGEITSRFAARGAKLVALTQLQTEAIVLTRWHAASTGGKLPVALALQMAGIELAALTSGKSVAPKRTSFASADELQMYLRDVRKREAAAKVAERQLRNLSDRELIELRKKHRAAIARLAGPLTQSRALCARWLAVSKRALGLRDALQVDRRRLLESYARVLDRSATGAPPFLESVVIGNQYQATWRVDREKAKARAAAMRAIAQALRLRAGAMGQMGQMRTGLGRARAIVMQRMHASALELEKQHGAHGVLASSKVLPKAVAALSAALSKLALTASPQELARDAGGLAAKAGARVKPGAMRLPASGMPKAYHALLEAIAVGGTHPGNKALINAYVAATKTGEKGATEVRAALGICANAPVVEAAAKRVALVAAKTRTELQALAGDAELARRWRSVIAQGGGALFALRCRVGEMSYGAVVAAGIGTDALGESLAGGVDTKGAVAQLEKSGGVATWKTLQGGARLRNLRGALGGLPPAAVVALGATVKQWTAGDDRKLLEPFWGRYALLCCDQQVLAAASTLDRDITAALHVVRGEIAGLLTYGDSLRASRALTRKVGSYIWDPTQKVRIELRFSARLTRAPRVTVGKVAVAMRPLGKKRAAGPVVERVWEGELDPKGLTDGKATLSVQLGKDDETRFDSDPATPVRLISIARSDWAGLESGKADARHQVDVYLAVHRIRTELGKMRAEMNERAAVATKRYDRAGMRLRVQEAFERAGSKGDDERGLRWHELRRLVGIRAGTERYLPALARFGQVVVRRPGSNQRLTEKDTRYWAMVQKGHAEWRTLCKAYDSKILAWLDKRVAVDVAKTTIQDPVRRAKTITRLKKQTVPLQHDLQQLFPGLPLYERVK